MFSRSRSRKASGSSFNSRANFANLALELKRNGWCRSLARRPESIEPGGRPPQVRRLLDELKIPQPRRHGACSREARVWPPKSLSVLVRPSYVLADAPWVIAYDLNTVQEYVAQASADGPARPVLIDQFLEEATEVDVDALADEMRVIGRRHGASIEEAGVHSEILRACCLRSVCLLRAFGRGYRRLHQAARQKPTGGRADERAVRDPRDTVYVLEVNPPLRGPSHTSARRRRCLSRKSPRD